MTIILEIRNIFLTIVLDTENKSRSFAAPEQKFIAKDPRRSS